MIRIVRSNRLPDTCRITGLNNHTFAAEQSEKVHSKNHYKQDYVGYHSARNLSAACSNIFRADN